MKDKRVRWRDTRLAESLSMFTVFIVSAAIISFTLFFFIPVPIIIYLKLVLFVVSFCSLLGILASLGIYFSSSKYLEYTNMKGNYLIPYIKNSNEVFSCIQDNKKYNDIEWKDNYLFKSRLCFLDTKRNVLFDKEGHYYYMSNKNLDGRVLNNTNQGWIEGWFTYDREHTRYSTRYGIKYLGKELNNV